MANRKGKEDKSNPSLETRIELAAAEFERVNAELEHYVSEYKKVIDALVSNSTSAPEEAQ